MAYQNKHDYSGECSRNGKRSEEVFRDLAVERGFLVVDSSLADQYKHTDFLIEKDGIIRKIDVKSRKKLKRTDSEPSDEYFWAEIQSVRGKEKSGWIYHSGGSAPEFVAFEMKEHFVIVSKLALQSLVEKYVNFEKFVDKATDAHYVIYQRKGRKDMITLVESSKLYDINPVIWNKN